MSIIELYLCISLAGAVQLLYTVDLETSAIYFIDDRCS